MGAQHLRQSIGVEEPHPRASSKTVRLTGFGFGLPIELYSFFFFDSTSMIHDSMIVVLFPFFFLDLVHDRVSSPPATLPSLFLLIAWHSAHSQQNSGLETRTASPRCVHIFSFFRWFPAPGPRSLVRHTGGGSRRTHQGTGWPCSCLSLGPSHAIFSSLPRQQHRVAIPLVFQWHSQHLPAPETSPWIFHGSSPWS